VAPIGWREATRIAHRIESCGNPFVVIDSCAGVVDTYTSEEAAQPSIAQCLKEDAMYQRAKLLMEWSQPTWNNSMSAGRLLVTGLDAQQKAVEGSYCEAAST
jgi:hypothetical protein